MKINKWCVSLSVSVALVFCCLPGHAMDSMRLFLVPPQGEIMAGHETQFFLFVHNPHQTEFTLEQMGQINITLVKPEKKPVSILATAESISPDEPLILAENSYAKIVYSFLLPEQMDGEMISLSLDELDAGKVSFAADRMPVIDRTEQISLGEREDVMHPLIEQIAPYEPTYFLFGVDPGLEKSKFQISFKYQPLKNLARSDGWESYLNQFHLAYTQTSFWNLSSESVPFEDTSYKPEAFYLFPKIDLGIPWVRAFGIQTGFQHESNGKDGVDSRSTNYLYLEPIMGIALGKEYFLRIAPRVWTYVNNDDATNETLEDYRGYFNLNVTTGNINGIVFDLNGRWSRKGPTFQIDISRPIETFKEEFGLYFHLQYFNGYAETLLQYQDHSESIRAGFSIVR